VNIKINKKQMEDCNHDEPQSNNKTTTIQISLGDVNSEAASGYCQLLKA
jgi:hypothetical protein